MITLSEPSTIKTTLDHDAVCAIERGLIHCKRVNDKHSEELERYEISVLSPVEMLGIIIQAGLKHYNIENNDVKVRYSEYS